MQIYCSECRKRYSTKCPVDYVKFDYYHNSPTKSRETGKIFGKIKEFPVVSERTYVLNCDCLQQHVRVLRFTHAGLLIKASVLKHEIKEKHLAFLRSDKTAYLIALRQPVMAIPYSKYIQLFYARPDSPVQATPVSLDEYLTRDSYISDFISLIDPKLIIDPEFINLKIA